MPPIQNTFTIVPDVPSAFNTSHDGNHGSAGTRPSRPPMTTKQVKKAYQKANKGPKLSKAEQRRQELFEQDRIRKEFEKEKNQARARAARDRKKEKEERERAEKKKKGLPLVNVRASQDTIARFVRAKPKSQKDCSASPLPAAELQGGETERRNVTPKRDIPGSSGQTRQFDDTNKENVRPPVQFEKAPPQVSVVATDNDRGLVGESLVRVPAEPPNKKRRIDVLEDKEETGTPFIIASGVASPSPKPNRKISVTSEHIEETSLDAGGLNIDDSFSTIDFSEEDLLDDLLRETESVHGTPNAPYKTISGQQQGQNPPTEFPPPKPPDYKNRVPSPKDSPPYLERTAMPTKSSLPPRQVVTQPEPILDTAKTLRRNSIPEQAKQISTFRSTVVPSASNIQKSQPIAPGSRSFHHPRSPMLPPPIPPKFKSSKVSTSPPKTPQFLKPPLPSRTPPGSSCHPRMIKPKQARENQPPPSTQLFFLSHLDDFLPSPSQEIREIFEEPKGKHARNNNQAGLKATRTRCNTSRSSTHIPKVLAAPYGRSVVSAPDITPGGPRHIQQSTNYTEPRNSVPRPPIQPIPENMASTFEMPFFSTQDLFLSSQDVKDIEEDPMPPPKARVPMPMPSKDCSKQQTPPRPSPKQFFNMSCRETRYKYIMERNRTAAWEGPEAKRKARKELDRFQAEEDKLLQALLDNPDEGGGDSREAIPVEENCATKPEATRGESPVTQLHSTPMRPAQPSHATHIDSLDRSARESTSGSGPIIGDAAQSHMRKPPDIQRSRSGTSSSGKSQRSTRPKGSYEAMLELLDKGPTPPRRGHGSSPPNGDRGDGARCSEKNQITKESHATAAIISASQETDYDCGEEWDDDDLLCDML